VRFVEPPLALYNDAVNADRRSAVSGINTIPSRMMPNGRIRLDVDSSQARAYVQHVQQQQAQHVSAMSAALSHAVTPLHSMQHALNAVVLELSPDEADQVARTPGVEAVEQVVGRPLATDLGPGLIGAASIWWGTPAGQDSMFATGFETTPGYFGDGIVVGDIDTGYNSQSPSFDATDDTGYTIKNPLGSGTYTGDCDLINFFPISLAGCNDKVIGIYDEISRANGQSPATVEDTQGHGSHTASTAAGNARYATVAGYTTRISGVAPHANLVIYYACAPPPVRCLTSATTASVDQAVQDKVDVLNYSISGGTDPWTDSTSLAFLAAEKMGIFIAAAAGNAEGQVPVPVPGSANHSEPWVTTVAAGTHGGGPTLFTMTLAGASSISLAPTPGGYHIFAPFTAPLKVSPTYGALNDACPAFAANTFANSIALLQYQHSCKTDTMAGNAIAAGAQGVVIASTDETYLSSGAVQPRAVFVTTNSAGTALQQWATSHVGVAATINFPATRTSVPVDALAGFSLLGPTYFDVIKPDVQAPGVSILAAVANPAASDSSKPSDPFEVALYDGTSMATPHTTGSAALIMGLNTQWSPMQVKSALMMTAKEAGLTKPDGQTPSDAFDRGSGRLQDYLAAKAGLVMEEKNFTNPANGGDPTTFNLASMQSSNCLTVNGTPSAKTCMFTRTFTTTQNHNVTWTASFTGAVSGAPFTMQIGPNTSPQTVGIIVNASNVPADGSFRFGDMVLTPNDASLSPLHLPIAVSVPRPSISVAPILIANGSAVKGTGTLTVKNVGGPTLHVTNTNQTTGTAPIVIVDQPSVHDAASVSALFLYVGFGTGVYTTDDLNVTNPGTQLSKLSFPGVTAYTPLSYLGGKINLYIFANSSGKPAGRPGLGGSEVWKFASCVGCPGVDVTGDTISIDLIAAGATPTNLAVGTYWIVVAPELGSYWDASNEGNGDAWYWFRSRKTLASHAKVTDLDNNPPSYWADTKDPIASMAMHIEQKVTCGAPWLSTAPATLTIDALLSSTVTVTADGNKFPSGQKSVSAYLCLNSDDAASPVYPVRISATKS